VSDMSDGGTTQLMAKLEELQGSLEEALTELRGLKKSRRTSRVVFGLIGVVIAGMFVLTFYVWTSGKDARDKLEEKFEQSQQENCELSRDSRASIRGVFRLVFDQIVNTSSNPEEVQVLAEQINQAILEAVPDRDCVKEARERRAQ